MFNEKKDKINTPTCKLQTLSFLGWYCWTPCPMMQCVTEMTGPLKAGQNVDGDAASPAINTHKTQS